VPWSSPVVQLLEWTLAKALHIRGHRIQFGDIELHGGHQASRLLHIRVDNPIAKVVMCVAYGAGCQSFTTHEMSQVGAESSFGRSAGDRVAVGAGSAFKDHLACAHRIADLRWPTLLLNPTIEVFLRIDVNPQQHFAVLGSAVLGALAEI